jgi:Na+-exporting ATPase
LVCWSIAPFYSKRTVSCYQVDADKQFPVVHIPVINDKVFLVKGLGWEWGIVFGMILVYLCTTELWKWGKRVYFRRKAAKQPGNAHPTDKTLRMEPTVAPRV